MRLSLHFIAISALQRGRESITSCPNFFLALMTPEARNGLGMSGRTLLWAEPRHERALNQTCLSFSLLFLLWKQEEGFFSGGKRGELRILEREPVPGQLSRLKHLPPVELEAWGRAEGGGHSGK